MRFSEALEQMEKGRVVARRCWPAFALNYGIAIHRRKTDCVLRAMDDGKWSTMACFMPWQSDIFATDWEVVEAVPPADVSELAEST